MKVTKAVVAVLATLGALMVEPAAAEPGFTPLNAELLPAMQRDLGITRAAAVAELAASAKANDLERVLLPRLGGAFGGAVFRPSTGRLEVRVTDPGLLGLVRVGGADPKLVPFTEGQLESIVDRLNASAASVPASIVGWGVDTENNRVKVAVIPGGEAEATAFLGGFAAGAAFAIHVTAAPRPLYDVRGGDAYYIAGRARCSVGFSVTVGFLSAGHCAAIGKSITGYNNVPMGSFATYRFPGADYSLAKVNSNWTPRGVVNNGTRVTGTAEAAIGAAVCKQGSTSGWTCGRIQAKNQTVRYAEGTVTGMIETNVHAEPGDSGGPLIAGNQAQGLLSGGDSSTTFFYPVRAALSATGATLVTN
jgi:hypothetical protein